MVWGISALSRGRKRRRQDHGGGSLANELHLDLYRSISPVVSKYIGETEPIRRVFDAVENERSLLLFVTKPMRCSGNAVKCD